MYIYIALQNELDTQAIWEAGIFSDYLARDFIYESF